MFMASKNKEKVVLMPEEKTIQFLKNMIQTENTIVNSLNESLDEIDNLAIKSLLKGISLDSMKHADLYKAAIILFSESRPPMNEKQLEKQRSLISKHLTMEENLIQTLENKIEGIKP